MLLLNVKVYLKAVNFNERLYNRTKQIKALVANRSNLQIFKKKKT